MATEDSLLQLGCETECKVITRAGKTTCYKFKVNYFKIGIILVGTDKQALIDEAYTWFVTNNHISNYNALNLFSSD